MLCVRLMLYLSSKHREAVGKNYNSFTINNHTFSFGIQ